MRPVGVSTQFPIMNDSSPEPVFLKCIQDASRAGQYSQRLCKFDRRDEFAVSSLSRMSFLNLVAMASNLFSSQELKGVVRNCVSSTRSCSSRHIPTRVKLCASQQQLNISKTPAERQKTAVRRSIRHVNYPGFIPISTPRCHGMPRNPDFTKGSWYLLPFCGSCTSFEDFLALVFDHALHQTGSSNTI